MLLLRSICSIFVSIMRDRANISTSVDGFTFRVTRSLGHCPFMRSNITAVVLHALRTLRTPSMTVNAQGVFHEVEEHKVK